MNLKILHIDDDLEILNSYSELLQDETIEGNLIQKVVTANFEEGMKLLQEEQFDLAILDLCKGDPGPESEKIGSNILEQIKKSCFVPVIFFTGLPAYVEKEKSDIVEVVSKGFGIKALKEAIQKILESEFIQFKKKVDNFTKDSVRHFFWDFVHPNHSKLQSLADDEMSIGYLLLRKLANSLSKEKIKEILGDDSIHPEKAHSMEFYSWPVEPSSFFELGEVLENENEHYLILTPSCDFIEESGRNRKAEFVLLAKASLLEARPEYSQYLNSQSKSKTQKLQRLIESRTGDRYFFLPGTPFMPDLIIDFQEKNVVKYNELSQFQRIAKLDSPFAQAAHSSFLRYYTRIGSPDIDSNHILSRILKS